MQRTSVQLFKTCLLALVLAASAGLVSAQSGAAFSALNNLYSTPSNLYSIDQNFFKLPADRAIGSTAGIALAPSEEGFRAGVDRARVELAAIGAPDDELLAHARASLFPSGDVAAMTDGVANDREIPTWYWISTLSFPS